MESGIIRSRSRAIISRLRRNANHLVAALAIALFCLPTANGGPWTHTRGHGRVEIYLQRWENDTDFNASGDSVGKAWDGSYDEFLVDLKLEHGISDRLDALISVPLKSAHYEDATGFSGRESGFGDFRLALKYRVTGEGESVDWHGWVAACQVGVKIPMGYDGDASPALGPDQVDVEGLFLLGRSFGQSGALGAGYAHAHVGYRYRDEDRSDELVYGVELGLDVPRLSGVRIQSTLGGVDGRECGSDLEEDYLNATVSLVKDFGSVNSAEAAGSGPSIEIGCGRTIDGKNTGEGTILFIKLAYNY